MFSTSNGYSLSDIAAVTGSNNRNGGFGDGDADRVENVQEAADGVSECVL